MNKMQHMESAPFPAKFARLVNGVAASRIGAVLLALCFSLVCFPASAYLASCSKHSPLTQDIPLPTNVAVGRDVAVGAALTSWVRMDGATNYWVCTAGANNNSFGVMYHVRAMADSGVDYDGYNVYKTEVAGVGIAIRVYAYAHSSWKGPSPIYPLTWDYASGNRYAWKNVVNTNFGGASDVILVKIGAITPGVIKAGYLYALQPYSSGDGGVWGGGGYDRKYNLKATTISQISCSTPDVTVALGSHAPSEFPNVGSRSRPVSFDLKVNSCPTGLNTVRYGFNFKSGTGYKPKEGLFGLSPSATAKGMQVRLMKADRTTIVELDKWYTLDSYNAKVAGSYVVPLSAAYERTGDITAGSADAQLVIAMSYE